MSNGKTDSHESFLRAIEQYYGSFSSTFKRGTVLTYLRENYGENQLHDLWTVLVQNHSSQFKSPPDIAIIEKVWKDAHPNEQPYPYAGGSTPIKDINKLQLPSPERTETEIKSVEETVKNWKIQAKEKEMEKERKNYYYPESEDDTYTRCLKKVRRIEDGLEKKEKAPF